MPIPSYVTGYPPDGSSLGSTKAQIRSNLDGTFQTLGVNHFDNNSPNAGQHQFIQMPNSSVAPPVPNGATEWDIYNGGSSFGPGTNDIFFLPPGAATLADAIQATRNEKPVNAVDGYSWLPGGILIQWGQKATPGGAGTVSYPIPFPSAVWNIQLNYSRSATSNAISFAIDSGGVNNTSQFTYYSTTTGSNVLYWLAIGK